MDIGLKASFGRNLHFAVLRKGCGAQPTSFCLSPGTCMSMKELHRLKGPIEV